MVWIILVGPTRRSRKPLYIFGNPKFWYQWSDSMLPTLQHFVFTFKGYFWKINKFLLPSFRKGPTLRYIPNGRDYIPYTSRVYPSLSSKPIQTRDVSEKGTEVEKFTPFPLLWLPELTWKGNFTFGGKVWTITKKPHHCIKTPAPLSRILLRLYNISTPNHQLRPFPLCSWKQPPVVV